MSALRVLDPGFLTTIQDRPRYGLARFGLSESGPAAPHSFLLANRLAGNPDPLPALEVTLKPPRLLFRAPATLGLAGADFGWKLDGRPVDTRRTVQVRAGATLHGDYCRSGLRGYIAFHSGLPWERWHGSAATHLEAGFGGLRLQRDSTLSLPDANPSLALSLTDPPPAPITVNGVKTLRILPGLHSALFPPEALSLLAAGLYRVTEHSNRTALRLDGIALPAPLQPILSAGAWHGAIQIPPSGQPQILGPEHPATGGYPILASVAQADHEHLGQLRPREEFRFGLITPRTALDLLDRQRSHAAG
jgi:biotin-dependent carboxylase-like uncharacterized protein